MEKNDLPIIIQDKTFVSKKLNYSKTKDEDGTQGDTVLVNGIVNPKLTAKRRENTFETFKWF